jgi:hypothetical protein
LSSALSGNETVPTLERSTAQIERELSAYEQPREFIMIGNIDATPFAPRLERLERENQRWKRESPPSASSSPPSS